MNVEIEARVLEINREEIIKKLEEVGAKLKWEHLQRRYVYDFVPKQKGKWIRLRTNGETTTLTIKNIVSSKIDGTKELEIIVDDFDKCHLLLKELGYHEKAYQENRRCQYLLDDVEIDIDDWPLIPTYIEIEASSEKKVYDVIELLELSKEKVTFKGVQEIYSNYGINLEDIKELKLEEERL